jgi:hypothetical protein
MRTLSVDEYSFLVTFTIVALFLALTLAYSCGVVYVCCVHVHMSVYVSVHTSSRRSGDELSY